MLSIYVKIHGHTCIPQSFIVPSNSTDWPIRFHGAKVGRSLTNIRSKYRKNGLSREAISLLEAHRIVWEPLNRSLSGSFRTPVLAEMLSIYASIYSNTLIPAKFCVPHNSTDWPSIFHGAKVGRSLAYMRIRYRENRLSSEAISVLESHNIVWEPRKFIQYNSL